MPRIDEVTRGEALPAELETIIGINLFDLDRVAPTLKQQLLKDAMCPTNPIRVSNKPADSVAVIFTCELLVGAEICDIIRDHDRQAGDKPTRVYLRIGGVWREVDADTDLSIVTTIDDQYKVILNSEVFSSGKTTLEDIDPLEPEVAQ